MPFRPSPLDCVKISLYIFNTIFFITGIVLISVGSTIKARYYEFYLFLDSPYWSLPGLFIATGVIIFLIVLVGFIGTWKENYVLILAFTFLLGFVFVLELSAGISGYALRDNTETKMNETLQKSIELYGKDKNHTQLWDDVQSGFFCCGIDGPQDWDEEGIPMACCSTPPGTISVMHCNSTNEANNLYETGCYKGLVSYIEDHASYLGAIGILYAVIQVLGIIIAAYLVRKLKYANH